MTGVRDDLNDPEERDPLREAADAELVRSRIKAPAPESIIEDNVGRSSNKGGGEPGKLEGVDEISEKDERDSEISGCNKGGEPVFSMDLLSAGG